MYLKVIKVLIVNVLDLLTFDLTNFSSPSVSPPLQQSSEYHKEEYFPKECIGQATRFLAYEAQPALESQSVIQLLPFNLFAYFSQRLNQYSYAFCSPTIGIKFN
jgi:hypothetical protein